MKYAVRIVVVALALGSLSGCSDSPEMLFHDLVVFWNEMADTMLSVNDEDTAKQVVATRGKQFKNKAKVLQDRIKNIINPPNGALNRTEKEDYNNGTLDYIDELMATNKRLSRGRERLDALIAGIKAKDASASTASLEAVKNLPCESNLTGGLAPGRFDPKSTSKQSQVGPGIPAPCGAGAGPGGGGFGRGGGR
jgi:hypothetical protein